MAAPLGEGIIRREWERRRRFNLTDEKRTAIVHRVCEFYERDWNAVAADRDRRLQRYAKYRQWRGQDTGWPWPGSSDQTIPDMMEGSIRMQDTLHNAVMSARPVVVSRAIEQKDKEKQRAVDALHDTQLFMENDGERVIEHACESFCNDPAVTFFTPWVKERRRTTDTRVFDGIPLNAAPPAYFEQLLKRTYPDMRFGPDDDEGWDWSAESEDGEEWLVSFYTKDDKVEMEMTREPIVFDGPSPRVLDYDDVICPPGVSNLHIPSPSNPGGAPHVILREYPTVDEIARLRMGPEPFYDLISAKDVEDMEKVSQDRSHRDRKDQQDHFEGVEQDKNIDGPQKPLTRLVCFDVYDIDGDGKTEDVIFWVIKETGTLLKVKLLTEMYPGRKPERPFAEAQFLPVGGRRAGISLLETMEGLHDFLKEVVDQMVDNGTITNLPWFTYRAGSSLKPEILRPGPGDGIPTNDPKNDIQVQSLGNQNQAFWLNLVSLIRQQMERLMLQGDLSAGRVPPGASSALRTLGGIQTLLSQGEARPERILRRFFMALRRVFRQMHRLNRYMLPEHKKFLAAGEILKPDEDPWIEVASSDIDVDMEFDFHANVLNSSKQAVQQGLQALLSVYVSDLAIQMGLATPDTIYRLLRDLGKSFGQNVDEYLAKPSPGADTPVIMAEEAVQTIMDGVMPGGRPAEGPTAHLQRIQEIEESDLFQAAFPPAMVPLLDAYKQQIATAAKQEQQLAAQAQAAGAVGGGFGANGSGGQQGQTPLPPQAVLNENELVDESLPTAGGGGVQ